MPILICLRIRKFGKAVNVKIIVDQIIKSFSLSQDKRTDISASGWVRIKGTRLMCASKIKTKKERRKEYREKNEWKEERKEGSKKIKKKKK